MLVRDDVATDQSGRSDDAKLELTTTTRAGLSTFTAAHTFAPILQRHIGSPHASSRDPTRRLGLLLGIAKPHCLSFVVES